MEASEEVVAAGGGADDVEAAGGGAEVLEADARLFKT